MNSIPTYTYKQVYDSTFEYFNGNKLLTDIWINKYTLKDKSGNYYELTPQERLLTITKEVVDVDKYLNQQEKEKFYKEVKELLTDFRYFIPGGSILYGVGNKQFLSSLGNCFVVGNNTDSYGSICMIDEEQVQLMKRRGGVGHDLSHLRPKGTSVNGCANSSTGSVSFAERYSNSTREVAQDGRRGALMLTHHINHPDVEDFITLKSNSTKVTGANISVKITNEFMNNVLSEQNHKFKFPIDSNNIVKDKSAKEIFNKLVYQSWKWAEPGILFWDKIIEESPADCYSSFGFETKSTNPCGELPLSPYDSCRLGHLNLYAYVEYPFSGKSSFNWIKFKKDVGLAQRIMDNVIDLEEIKIKEILSQIENSYDDETSKQTEKNLWNKILNSLILGRRTGLGVMGEGDMLAALGFQYGSEDGNKFAIEVHRTMAIYSYMASIKLAKEKGSFPIWSTYKEKNNPFINRILEEIKKENINIYNDYFHYGRRNIANLTIAPTGTTGQIANKQGVSSGIEPVFEVFYKRRRKINPNDKYSKVDFIDEVGDSWEEYYVFHPTFLDWYKYSGKESLKCIEDLSNEEIKNLIKESPYYMSTANEVDVISKIRLQGGIQRWIDHSISVTHNLPKETTVEQVYDYYIEAWKSGCKGITIYRDGSRSGVLIREDEDNKTANFSYTSAQERPSKVECEIHRLYSKGEYWYIIVELIGNKPYGIFAIKEDKLPSCFRISANTVLKGILIREGSKKYNLFIDRPDTGEKISIKDIVSLMETDDDRTDTKRFSLELRHRISPLEIAETIEKQPKEITSFEKAIARVLKKYITDGTKSGVKCQNCGSTNVIYASGCPLCLDCGDSKCG